MSQETERRSRLRAQVTDLANGYLMKHGEPMRMDALLAAISMDTGYSQNTIARYLGRGPFIVTFKKGKRYIHRSNRNATNESDAK